MAKNKYTYCCERFKESVEEGFIQKAKKGDETDWFFKEWLHIYFCPFCGTKVKGSGYGIYDIETNNIGK